MEFGSVDEILEFAIKKEEEAAQFYSEWAGKAESSRIRQIFDEFAAEEKGHKEKLLRVKAGKQVITSTEKFLPIEGEFQCRGRLHEDFYELQPNGSLQQGQEKMFQCRGRLHEDFYVANAAGGLVIVEGKFQCRGRLHEDFYQLCRRPDQGHAG